MPRYNYYFAATAYHEAWGLMLSSGENDDGSCCYDAVTITNDAKEFYDTSPMPYGGGSSHCIAAIDANRLFTTGLDSFGDEDKSYLYYKDTGEWAPLPDMPTGRYEMGCGVVRDGNGQIEVVVVGGRVYPDYINTVEIFNIEEATWRTGKYFKYF